MSDDMTMIGIHCRFRVDPKQRSQYDEAATRRAQGCLEEPGCLVYEYSEDLSDPNTIYNYQLWASQEAFDAHQLLPDVDDRHAFLGELAVKAEEVKFFNVSLQRDLVAERETLQGGDTMTIADVARRFYDPALLPKKGLPKS
jgi:quinol monooxygenase YgiN